MRGYNPYEAKRLSDIENAALRQDLERMKSEVERWRRIAQDTPVPIIAQRDGHDELLGRANLIMQAEQKELRSAIRVLVQCHTHDDDRVGFVVEMMASPEMRCHSQGEYIEAWKVLRAFIHERTDPQELSYHPQ